MSGVGIKMKSVLSLLLFGAIVSSCGTMQKERKLGREMPRAKLSLVNEDDWRSKYKSPASVDPLLESEPLEMEITDLEGNKVILMRAVEDEISGEMIAVDELEAATVQARFRNIPERNGEVEVAFEINIPSEMQDPNWQIRFSPELLIMGDTVVLDQVLITGDLYRQKQLRGYQLYEKYLKKIIPDSANFYDYYTYRKQLDIFIARNIPELSRLREDTTITAISEFGIDVDSAISHYTKQWLLKANKRRKGRRGLMYQKYVKAPIVSENIRLDSIITSADNSITYYYLQRVPVRPHLRKIELMLGGSVFESDREIYTMNQSDPLTFYVSSISTLADDSPRYIKKVVERNKEDNLISELDFTLGKFDFDPSISNNSVEIIQIKEKIFEIIENDHYIIDSLIITASCSPEGKYRANASLAMKRGHSVMKYLTGVLEEYRDSLIREKEKESKDVFYIDGAGEDDSLHRIKMDRIHQIEELLDKHLISKYIAEDWDEFAKYIHADSILDFRQKEYIYSLERISDLDRRESTLRQSPLYGYLSSNIYPRLRCVKFDFHTHIKGMIKDTIHTSEIDTSYMRGVEAIKERDYQRAVNILRDYRDYNTAVVYTSLNLNFSALEILETLPHSPKSDYLKAIAQSRLGEEKNAVKSLLNAIKQDYSMIHRANLDPEISELIYKYRINEIVEQNNY